MAFVGGVFKRAMMTRKLTVLNNDLAVTLHTIIIHVIHPRVSDLLPHSARNSPTR